MPAAIETISWAPMKGFKLATMGNSDTNKVKLYFEIRRNGKPVNVMALLPAR